MSLIDNGYKGDINYRTFNDDILHHSWLKRSVEVSDKCLWSAGLPFGTNAWATFINDHIEHINQADKILLHIRPENYSYEFCKPVIDILISLGKGYSDIMLVGNNFISPIENIKHFTEHQAFNTYSVYNKLKYTDISKRKYDFVSLAGVPRPNRVLFTKELLARNLQDKGIITCGSATNTDDIANTIFDHLSLGEYRSHFPIIYDSMFDSMSLSNDIHFPFLDAKFNIVLETCYEDVSDLKTHPVIGQHWAINKTPELFMTEKTVKALSYYQIPIFVAAKGYVSELRKLNFDLFDDIINHDYDNIDDPFIRMKTVADEVDRLLKLPLDYDKFKSRLISNHNKVPEVHNMIKYQLSLEILKWFNQ